MAVAPRYGADRARMLAALAERVSDEPSLQVAADGTSGQIMLCGASEIQLEVEISRLRREDRIDLLVGAPQVVHRETVTRRVERDHTHRERPGSPGQFARATIAVEPNAAGAGNLFASPVADGARPMTYGPAVRNGIARALRAGVLSGRPVVDVRVTLVDGIHSELDPWAPAFMQAGLEGARRALLAAGPVLLDPTMAVEVAAWGAGAGAVADDLRTRGAEVRVRPPRGGRETIGAKVALSAMLGYAAQLRSLTGGLSYVEMLLDHYRLVRPSDELPPPPTIAMRA